MTNVQTSTSREIMATTQLRTFSVLDLFRISDFGFRIFRAQNCKSCFCATLPFPFFEPLHGTYDIVAAFLKHGKQRDNRSAEQDAAAPKDPHLALFEGRVDDHSHDDDQQERRA